MTDTLGIIGAGKLALTLARTALAAGYQVMISGSGPADRIALQAEVLAPGARIGTTADVAAFADTVILALPMHRFRELPPDLFTDKVLIDAMNYWPDTDGDDAELAEAADGTSSVVQRHFRSARVVKTLNQLGYHEIEDYAHTQGTPPILSANTSRQLPDSGTTSTRSSDRIAIGIAGDSTIAVHTAMQLIDRLGFDPVNAGPLVNGRVFEPDGSPYATTYTAAELTHRLAALPHALRHPA
jgi:predicted dinucleotide-binding enzyme